eukprot:COSAG04_NODE_9084_length_900_cov_1.573034_2_plen_103_part_00
MEAIVRMFGTDTRGGFRGAGDLVLALTKPLEQLPPTAAWRMLLAAAVVCAPLFLRQYCHMKEGSVAGYSDLYDVKHGDQQPQPGREGPRQRPEAGQEKLHDE